MFFHVKQSSDGEGKLRLNVADVDVFVVDRTREFIILVVGFAFYDDFGFGLERVGDFARFLSPKSKRP